MSKSSKTTASNTGHRGLHRANRPLRLSTSKSAPKSHASKGLLAMNSPLKRYAFDPNRIPAPSPRYNLARTLISGGGNPGFETRAEARQEDRLRARRLKKSSDSALAQFGRLLEEATAEKALLLSCASALYM